MDLIIFFTILSFLTFTRAQNTSANGTIIYGVSQSTYTQLSKMASIAMATYADPFCDPSGYPILYSFHNTTTDTVGWILRDDADKQLMLVFRGSESALDFEEDGDYNLTAFEGYGEDCEGCLVHEGYWKCWTSVRDGIIDQMKTQSSLNPGYSWVIIGHSLGGSVASLAAAQTYDIFPHSNMIAYTQGQPRTGNAPYKKWVEDRFGTGASGRFLRSAHKDDTIPHLPPQSDGYVHHATEYWNLDPSSAENTWICNGEDGTECCEAQPESVPDHLIYYGHPVILGGNCSLSLA